MLDRMNDVLEWVCDCPGNTTLEVGRAVRGIAHGYANSTLHQWAQRRLWAGVEMRLVKKPKAGKACRWELTKKGKRFVEDIESPPPPPFSLPSGVPGDPSMAQLVLWMERGCPVFLCDGDQFARPLGDCRIAVECLKRGLAALDNIEQDGPIWRRVK